MTEADVHDTRGARCLIAGLKYFVPRLKKIRANAAYRGQELAEWCKTTGGWELEVVERAGRPWLQRSAQRVGCRVHFQLDFPE